jgi:hypothetical protein
MSKTKTLIPTEYDIADLMNILAIECDNNPNHSTRFNSKIFLEGGCIKFELQEWEKAAMKHFVDKHGNEDGIEIFNNAKKILKKRLLPQVH